MRYGSKIWWCKRLETDNEETPSYEKPKEFITRPHTLFSPIGITVMPKTGTTDYFDYGETTNSDQRIVLTPYDYWYGKFKEGDVFYLDGAIPSDKEGSYGEEANYYLDFVGNQEYGIVLSLKQIKNKYRRN